MLFLYSKAQDSMNKKLTNLNKICKDRIKSTTVSFRLFDSRSHQSCWTYQKMLLAKFVTNYIRNVFHPIGGRMKRGLIIIRFYFNFRYEVWFQHWFLCIRSQLFRDQFLTHAYPDQLTCFEACCLHSRKSKISRIFHILN